MDPDPPEKTVLVDPPTPRDASAGVPRLKVDMFLKTASGGTNHTCGLAYRTANTPEPGEVKTPV